MTIAVGLPRLWIRSQAVAEGGEGEATDRVTPPRPLGRMGARLQEIYELPVERRPLDLYAALAEVAR